MTEQPRSPRRPAPAASAAPLTERQEARRRRILAAGAELARRGGFDAVQMREVAESSQVALGTLYRYFPSKVHLLVAALHDRLERLRGTLRSHPPREAEPAARVAETLLRAFGSLRREPEPADAMLRAFTFADRSAGAEVDAVSRLTAAIVLEATGRREPPTPELLPVVRVIGHTWHSALIAWVSGRSSADQVDADIRTVCGLVSAVLPGDARR
ncbi:TetR family transcriptional regulator [Streptomyces sp. URMC 125]|uniref:TetR family transcriptional regulator n=1 Tax=Streptomyces sp. URMC 125 TaxID=3423419 RepID=UPI003F1A7710